tara:strand:- start:579 stop:830 length:252 start_codon:yes stop_codon:yes gene_type:complete
MMKILVSGGAGFIGSSVIGHLVIDLKYSVINVDKLTYAGNLESAGEVDQNSLYTFDQVDICDVHLMNMPFNYNPGILGLSRNY